MDLVTARVPWGFLSIQLITKSDRDYLIFSSFLYSLVIHHVICCIEQCFYSVIYQVMCPLHHAQIYNMYCCVVQSGQSILDTYQEAS